MQPPQLPPVTLSTFGESELEDLDGRTAHILRMRSGMMGETVTLREVGEELGLKRERVRQLEREGLMLIRRLREMQRHQFIPPQQSGYVWRRWRRWER
jgi:DNA-directed RNA polymerase sigma subunit (sigma70/sigma32)